MLSSFHVCQSSDVQVLTSCRRPLQRQILRTLVNTLILGIDAIFDLPVTPSPVSLPLSKALDRPSPIPGLLVWTLRPRRFEEIVGPSDLV